jgi:hypothetical protein
VTALDEFLKQSGKSSGTALDAVLSQPKSNIVPMTPDMMTGFGTEVTQDQVDNNIFTKVMEGIAKGANAFAGGIVNTQQRAAEEARKLQQDNPNMPDNWKYEVPNVPKPTEGTALDAALRGWNKGASYKESMSPEWVKENPGKATAADIALQVVFDPLNIITPAGVVKGVTGASRAIGLTDKLGDAAQAIKATKAGQKATTFLDDVLNTPIGTKDNKLSLKQWFSPESEIQSAVDKYTVNMARSGEEIRTGTDMMDAAKKGLSPDQATSAERLTQRLVEALDPADVTRTQLEGRQSLLTKIQSDIEAAKSTVAQSKIGLEKAGALSDREQKFLDILKKNNVPVEQYDSFLKEFQALDYKGAEKAVTAAKLDPLIKPKTEAIKQLEKGKMSLKEFFENGTSKMFGPDELKDIAKGLSSGKPIKLNGKALDELEQMAQMPQGASVTPASALESDVLGGIGRAEKQIVEQMPTGTRTPYKWEDAIRLGNEGKLKPDEIQALKGILTPEEAQTFLDKAVSRDRNRQAIFEGATKGTLTPSDVLKFQDLFNSQELRQIGEQLSQRYDKYAFGVSKNENVRKLIYGIKEAAERKAVEEATSDALAKGLKANIDKPLKNVNVNGIDNVLGKENVNADVPNLLNGKQPILDGSGVLPKPNLDAVPKPAQGILKARNVDLSTLTNAEIDFLKSADPKDMKGLVERTKAVEQYNRDINKLEAAQRSLERFDVSPDTVKDVLDDFIKSGFTPAQTQSFMKVAEYMRTVTGRQTMEALQRGLIPTETAAAYSNGRHLRRMYSSKDTPQAHYNKLIETGQVDRAKKFLDDIQTVTKREMASGRSLDLNVVIERQNLPKSVRDAYGQIYEASLPFARGGELSEKLLRTYDMLEDVRSTHAVDMTQIPAGKELKYKQFKSTDGKWGPLEGKYVPDNIYSAVVYADKQNNFTPGWWQKAVGFWKYGKTILNPATHFRNVYSIPALLDARGVPLHEGVGYVLKAAREMKREGKYYQSARKETDILINTYAKNELGKTLERSDSQTRLGKVWNATKSVLQKPADLYQKEEVLGKMAAFMWAQEQKGMSVANAAKFAQEALFNYSKVPPAVDMLRRTGIFPFLSFPYFAAKSTANALYNRPAALSKYYKTVNAQQSKDEQNLMPNYIDPKFMLPIDNVLKSVGIDRTIKTDATGKQTKVKNYLDLKYILPFESWMPDNIGLSPAITGAVGMIANKDGLGRDIARDGMTPEDARKEKADFLWKLASPSLAPGNYAYDKLVNQGMLGKSDYKGRTYDLPEAVAHTIFGLKNAPLNLEENRKNRLREIEAEQRGAGAQINNIMRDATLTKAEKEQRRIEYMNHKKKLAIEAKNIIQSYKRLKQKGEL